MIRRFILLIAILFICSLAVTEEKLKKTELEGSWSWQDTTATTGWTFVFGENNFRVTFLNSPLMMAGEFVIGVDDETKTIDLMIKECHNPKFINATSLGIYKLEKDILTIALNEPGLPNRPDSFEISNQQIQILIMKKDEE